MAGLLTALIAHEPAEAQTRWLNALVYVCPKPLLRLINGHPDECKWAPSGTKATAIGVEADYLGRKFIKIEIPGGVGYVSENDFERAAKEDPKIVTERERQRTQKASADRKKTTEAAEAKRKKQAQDDDAEIAKMPREAFTTPCILAAAERLPRIAGISIEASRAIDLPAGTAREPGSFQAIIEIDAKAAGVAATYHFVCAKGLRTPPIIVGFRP